MQEDNANTIFTESFHGDLLRLFRGGKRRDGETTEKSGSMPWHFKKKDSVSVKFLYDNRAAKETNAVIQGILAMTKMENTKYPTFTISKSNKTMDAMSDADSLTLQEKIFAWAELNFAKGGDVMCQKTDDEDGLNVLVYKEDGGTSGYVAKICISSQTKQVSIVPMLKAVFFKKFRLNKIRPIFDAAEYTKPDQTAAPSLKPKKYELSVSFLTNKTESDRLVQFLMDQNDNGQKMSFSVDGFNRSLAEKYSYTGEKGSAVKEYWKAYNSLFSKIYTWVGTNFYEAARKGLVNCHVDDAGTYKDIVIELKDERTGQTKSAFFLSISLTSQSVEAQLYQDPFDLIPENDITWETHNFYPVKMIPPPISSSMVATHSCLRCGKHIL